MRKYDRFFQMNLDCFTPFNEAPTYLRGNVSGTDADKIIISGKSEFQVVDWYKMGCRTPTLQPHSFAFSVDAIPLLPMGAYSIGIYGDCSINIAHFIYSSISLLKENLAENAYSGWGYDNTGHRTQQGEFAPWESLNKRHNLTVTYDMPSKTLAASVNGFPIHQVIGDLGEFSLSIRFEAVGVEGKFNIAFENICYYSLDSKYSENIVKLCAWDPQYAPVFVSYSHSDKAEVHSLVQQLHSEGVRVLGDWNFRPGDSLFSKISKSITRSGYFLIFLSKNSISSSWVAKELEIGINREFQEKRVYVLPILIDECEIPIFLQSKLYADLRTSPQEGITSILNTLRRHGSW
jgi:hypothetical protein